MLAKNAPIVWSIAASDSGGGAGIQADLKTFFDLGVHGCNIITAITAQNTQGVHDIQASSESLFNSQLNALASDLWPVAIKIGVLPSADIVTRLIQFFSEIPAERKPFVVLDTVLSPTLGKRFSSTNTIDTIKNLLPYIDLVTPNIPEAEILSGLSIHDTDTQLAAAQALTAMGVPAVLLKGGHGKGDVCQDLWVSKEQVLWLSQKKQDTPHSHGTGCVLSSAIAAFVAHQKPVHDAVVLANAYVSKGLHDALPLGVRGAVAQTAWPDDLQYFPQISYTPDAIDYPAMATCDSLNLGLYPVVDSVEWLQKLLILGVTTIQLRVKDIPGAALDEMVAQAAELGRRYQARLFINDYWQLAIKHNAYGVHLGQEDMVDADVGAIREAGLRLGISTHGDCEFSYAATFKPSYLAIGAIFPTDTKEVVEVGVDNLHRWARILKNHYPLVAIGGINQSNIHRVLASGVGSVAVVSAVTKADDYRVAVKELTDLIH